ncbi:hypothetical protein WJX72_007868 [[Myrmecia] bisecta]|uniref:RNA helicase n=1 Tax=[Myrmecia] bisecta TaxID=41462 RepID=A0AAW1R888_9CHLO
MEQEQSTAAIGAAAPRPPPRLSRPNFVAQQISAAVSRIQGLFPALPHPLVVVALQALLQSVITLPPPHFSSATDMQAGLDEVLRKSGPAKPLQLQWLHNALAPGLEDYIVGVVMAACAWLVQVYLAGESLPTFGGNLVRSHGQPAERPGKALGHLPNASRQELEGALQACLLNPELMQPAKVEAARLPPPLLPPPLGSRCALPEELAMWRAASGLPRLHAEALKDMMWLVRDEGGLSVGPEPAGSARPNAASDKGPAQALPPGRASQQHSRGAYEEEGQRLYVRELLAVNQAPADALLIDIRAVPAREHTFALVDDLGLARHRHVPGRQGAAPPPPAAGVRLKSGDHYPVAVLLDCSDGNDHGAEAGLLQQVVLFTFAVRRAIDSQWLAAQAILGFPVPSAACREAVGEYTVLVIGRRVTVALTRHVAELQRMLNIDAKPFVAAHLKSLFDTEPTLYHPQTPPLAALIPDRALLCSLVRGWPQHSANLASHNQPTREADYTPPAAARQQAAWLRTRVPVAGAAAAVAARLRRLARLIALEEAAMEHDIKRYDMFNVRLKYAVFTKGGRQYRIHSTYPPLPDTAAPSAAGKAGPARSPSADPATTASAVGSGAIGSPLMSAAGTARPAGSERRHVYRGPSLSVLFPEGLRREGSPLVVLEVPGLPEARPKLVFGDTVYLRMAARPGIEYAATMEDQGVIHGSELVHMRFSFDRTLLLRMHAALSASVRADVALLPDDEASKQIIARLPKAADVDAVASSIRELGAQTLNQEQRAAVAALLCGAGVAAPYALFGPPGTGKTVTMVECALQILQRQPGAHLLLCAPQSYSADLLCSAMAKAGITSKQMLRLHDPRHPPPQVKQDVLQFSMLDETVRAFALPSAEQVAGYSVIITTCGAAGFVREIMQSHAAGSDGHLGSAGMQLTLDFSHVLIDEAGQALLPEALIPLTLLAQGGSSMLCGDPRQLGPVVRSPVSAANGLAASLLEGFIAQHQQLVPRCTELGLVAPTGMLVRNYRSHSRLLELPRLHGSSDGDAEYAEGAEHAGDAGDGEFLDDAEDDFEDDFEAQLPTSTLFFGVRGQQMREGEAPSYFNPLEAAALVDLLAGLLAPRPGVGGVSEDDIGVIATYRKQAQKIRALLRERGHGKVRVGTVDDYQGQEERIIFISTVLSRPESLPPQRAKQAQHDGADRPDHDADAMHVGFWRNPKRFNVAITRAKALLVVVGHPIVLMQDDSWRELVRHCAARGAYRGAGAETMAQLVRSDALSVARVPGLDGAFEAGPGEEDGDAELARTVEQIAELALLGVGHADRMFPSTLKEAYNAFGNNELEWRIAL